VVNATLAAALDYAAHGFSVIPFQRARKVPALRGGEISRFRAQAAPVRLLRRWFAGDRHNVGLITGSRWRLLVLDVDGEEGLRSVRGLPNPPTPRVRTHRGYQAWFRHDGPPVPTRLKALPGVDLLAEAWQVLAPPSRHPAGSVTPSPTASRSQTWTSQASPAGSLSSSTRPLLTIVCGQPHERRPSQKGKS
jgi:hypothetical protein